MIWSTNSCCYLGYRRVGVNMVDDCWCVISDSEHYSNVSSICSFVILIRIFFCRTRHSNNGGQKWTGILYYSQKLISGNTHEWNSPYQQLRSTSNWLRNERTSSPISAYRGSGRFSVWSLARNESPRLVTTTLSCQHCRYRRKSSVIACQARSSCPPCLRFTVAFPWFSWFPGLCSQGFPNLVPRVIRVIYIQREKFPIVHLPKRDFGPSGIH